MAARTRTIQRTPNVGLTLKMQPLQEAAPLQPLQEAAPCVPAPTGPAWRDPDSGEYNMQTIAISLSDGFTSALAVAQVNGDLCDCSVEWDIQWEPSEMPGE